MGLWQHVIRGLAQQHLAGNQGFLLVTNVGYTTMKFTWIY